MYHVFSNLLAYHFCIPCDQRKQPNFSAILNDIVGRDTYFYTTFNARDKSYLIYPKFLHTNEFLMRLSRSRFDLIHYTSIYLFFSFTLFF